MGHINDVRCVVGLHLLWFRPGAADFRRGAIEPPNLNTTDSCFACRFLLVGSKVLPPTGNVVLDFLRTDWYYSLLIPLSVPVTLVAVYANWLALKFFRHAA